MRLTSLTCQHAPFPIIIRQPLDEGELPRDLCTIGLLTVHLARLQTTRARLATRMSEIDDYMNWFEATQSRTKSGEFAEYLKAAQEQNEARPRRRDALSVCLDALEEQFRN